jgi:hypothetical protein
MTRKETTMQHSTSAFGYTAILDTSDWTVEIVDADHHLVGSGVWYFAGRPEMGVIDQCDAVLTHPDVDQERIWEALDDGLKEALFAA